MNKVKRTGVIARKIGMTQIFNKENYVVPVTLVKLEENYVVDIKKEEKHGYNAMVLGYNKVKDQKITKPLRIKLSKSKLEPMKFFKEFLVSANCFLEVGKKITIDHFLKGQYIDVTGISIGKGFAGSMKRHNFKGLEATHGVSISHRSHGSTGQCQDPGKVFKGKKMAGQLGNKRNTVQNIKIVDIDVDLGILALKGSVPGANNSFLLLKDAIKKAVPSSLVAPKTIEEK